MPLTSREGPHESDAPESASRPSLEVRDLTVVTDAGSVVVDGVGFTVATGEVFGLVGESGSGKTTIALALLGHTRRGLRLTSGEVLLNGRDVLRQTPRQLRSLRGSEIAYVPQDPSSALNPALRVGRQVDEALVIHGTPPHQARARTQQVLREVGLDPDADLLGKYPHQMSGGQQQRVVLAMAFACRPRVIVLDEPTTGLDVSVQRQVLETMSELCGTYGVAAVYVTHDLAVVSGIATRVGVAYAGRIVEQGPCAQVFRHPAHPYTNGLLASIPSPEGGEVLRGIPGQPPQVGERVPGCAFGPRCDRRTDECATHQPDPVVVDGAEVRCFHPMTNDRPQPRIRLAVEPVAPGQPRLEVRGLRASYGGVEVLHDVDLTVGRQQCLAVVGESGAGKTTLAQCIAGLHRAWTGEVCLDGESLSPELRRRDRDLLRRVQYVFQNPYLALNPRKTVRQIVREPLQHFFSLPRDEADEEVLRVLGDVAIARSLLDRYPDQLSGGQRQRVAIARAVAVRPDVLICDEVTSALDVSVQAVIVELLRGLKVEHDLSLVFITHNLALVRSVAQEAIVLSQGRVVERGTVDQILESPSDPYTRRLIGDMPRLEDVAAGIEESA